MEQSTIANSLGSMDSMPNLHNRAGKRGMYICYHIIHVHTYIRRYVYIRMYVCIIL